MSTTIINSQSCQTLDDWLYYIEQSHPIDKIELGLARVEAVANKGQLQHLPGKKVLIAGTNGKGTTARCIEQLLLAQGATVGVYSSPHLLRFNERLRINGQDVADNDWVAAFAYIEQLRGDIGLTYFEFTTLVSFHLLRQAKLDYCIIEVGLGGRLDATNIIQPDVSVITTIDLDHQDWLGNDRNVIGREKAGVFRADAVAVIGELDVPPSVIAYAKELNCDSRVVNKDYTYSVTANSWSWHSGDDAYTDLPLPSIPAQNIACSLVVLQQLQQLPTASLLRAELKNISLVGRMQWLQSQPAIILDVAHNPQSAQYLAQQLSQLSSQYKRIIALVGMLKDKDIEHTLLPLLPIMSQWHVATLAVPRGATSQQLAQVLTGSTAEVIQHNDVVSTFKQLRQQLQAEDLLVVLGSFVTVSAVLSDYKETK
ncbi:bifunctional tetrahydrofolate synthase/dihydrofolate synthase [Rheinheimera salexigens]|uniref:Dihydrofolate synthase/folylpolyglutamate synthase n=1 Tax=Rheinheimera salexigens TaxID=1628148 RepID=A0A1E7Q4Z7_9GAMM|nr:bifunctional tetrahydrofolate synthase/dihydrofolate synthase [Rheinheimera salexigens]OEY69262.1 bifunctional folylpolyglutamate synthase/dihydrofolate synthase [Rheinheimera salexigens]